MTNRVLIQKLRFLDTRINTLRDRIMDLRLERKVDDYNGFVPGMFSVPCAMLDIFDDQSVCADFFRDWLCKTYEPDTPEYNLEYHLQNVAYVIERYFEAVIVPDSKFKPNTEVLDCHANGLEMVSKAVKSVIERISAEENDIDPFQLDLDSMKSERTYIKD